MGSIAVVDCGVGNLRSMSRALEHVAPRHHVVVTDRAADLDRADRVVLPGQGAMGTWMGALDRFGLRGSVLRAIATRPVLGVCLGLQALYEASDEDGGIAGFGSLCGSVRHFSDRIPSGALKIPHMGWNKVIQTRPHPLWAGIEPDAHFYFVHSYFVDSATDAETVGETEYGTVFTSAAAFDNVFAVQFHPEKSQRAGLTLLRNFLSWDA
ncbi:MAG: imidazole glycerol phosphate synthase subunit HisH [Gammaproteobacteria bacterium]|nr:imidazole glycerol phosphate synthase subunit HisH [Gammaproteobacteria bacterium]